MDGEKRLYLDRYHVTIDGAVMLAKKTSAGPVGRHLMPSDIKGSACYFIRVKQGENARPTTIRSIVKSVFGIDRKFNHKTDVDRLREKAVAANEPLLVGKNKEIAAGKTDRAVVKQMRRPLVGGRSTFATMRTGSNEFSSWLCPSMLPFDCAEYGHDVPERKSQRGNAA